MPVYNESEKWKKRRKFFFLPFFISFFLIIRAKKEKSRHLQRQKNSINDDCTYERLFSTGKIIKNMSPEGLINCGDLVFIDCNSVFIFFHRIGGNWNWIESDLSAKLAVCEITKHFFSYFMFIRYGVVYHVDKFLM